MVTTVLAACQRLARQPAHEDLLGMRFQVLQDVCDRMLQVLHAIQHELIRHSLRVRCYAGWLTKH